MKKIKIELKDIKKLQHLYMDIFYEEDEDYPNRRIVSNKERAVQRILDKITNNKEIQNNIYNTIIHYTWDNTDYTFKPICDGLRKLGYKIVNTYKEKQKEKNKKYYQENKENRKEYQKNWNKNHKDKVLKNNRNYKNRHKEELIIKKKEWYEKNKEKILQQQKEYRKNKRGVLSGKN